VRNDRNWAAIVFLYDSIEIPKLARYLPIVAGINVEETEKDFMQLAGLFKIIE